MGGALQKCLGAPAPATTSRELPTDLAGPPDEPAPAIPLDSVPITPPAPSLNGNGMAEKGGVNGAPAAEHLSRIASVHEEPGLQQPVLTATSIVHTAPPLDEAGPWEDVNWLNAFLQQAWPSLNEAASKVARESIDAILKQYQPDAIQVMRVKSLDLGEVPPVFKEVRVRTEHEPDEILLDVKLDWKEGKPTMVLEIKPWISPVGFAIKLKDLDLVAWTRIAFKPLTGVLLPCFGAMTIAIQEEPYVNFQIEALGGVTNLIPGLDALIDSTVKGAIVDALLWPNRIVVPIIPREDNYKDLMFWPSGELRISSIACADLPTMRSLTDVAGVPDPIVWFYVRKKADRIIKTTPKSNARNPSWDEELKVMVEDPALQNLTVVVMDQEALGRATFIGMAVVPLAGIADGEERNISLDLHVETFFMPEAQKANTKNADQLRGTISFKMMWHKYLPEEVPPVPAPVPPKAPEMQPAPDTVSDIPVAAPPTPAPTEK